MSGALGQDPVQLFIFLAALGMLPFLVVLVTPFAKILIVLMLTRNALGLQGVPPALVLNGIALILTAYAMVPVLQTAYEPVRARATQWTSVNLEMVQEAAQAGREPLLRFLGQHAHPRERAFFLGAAKRLWPSALAAELHEDDPSVLVPAFLLSQIGDGFAIGMVIYLVLIVVDFIVAAVLLAMNMSMVNPTIVSVPFKLLLFSALDGWSALAHNLLLSYR